MSAAGTMFDAAQAMLALVLECLDDCHEYARNGIDTNVPPVDCSSLTVVIGAARAVSGSCPGNLQLQSSLDVYVTRCCEPVGDLTSGGGYVPPTPGAISAAVACLARDVWALYECIICQACDTIGAVQGVEACCDRNIPAPEIIWPAPQGGCRTGIIRVPVIFTVCCAQPEPPIGGAGFTLTQDAFPTLESSEPVEMAVDSTGRYLVAATVGIAGQSYVAIYRFLESGLIDGTWGTSGLLVLNVFATVGDQTYGMVLDQSDDSMYLAANLDTSGTLDNVVLKVTSAGTLDGAWGVGGVASLGVGSGHLTRSLALETTGEVVAAINGPDTIFRLDAAGAIIDTLTLTDPFLSAAAVAQRGADGQYVAITNTGVNVQATGFDLDLLTENSVVIGPTATTIGSFVSTIEPAVDSAGNVYFPGSDGAGVAARVIKVDNTLTLDAGFGVAGIATHAAGSTNAGAVEVMPLAGGDLIVSGTYSDDGGTTLGWYTMRLSPAGVLVPAYGVAGIAQYPAIGTGGGVLLDSVLEESDLRAVHVGDERPLGSPWLVIARTLLADGSLDPTFGP